MMFCTSTISGSPENSIPISVSIAGHAQGSTTERYLHAHRTSYPDAAELAEARTFATLEVET